jgi:hypothetical protein
MMIGLAAAGVAALLAMPLPAVAIERPADGVRNLNQTEFSAARRKRRVVRRYVGPRYYYRPYYYRHYDPYYAYGYYPYHRRYYRPGPFVGFGPGGFSFGFGF